MYIIINYYYIIIIIKKLSWEKNEFVTQLLLLQKQVYIFVPNVSAWHLRTLSPTSSSGFITSGHTQI